MRIRINKEFSIGRLYFIYLFAVLFLQIIDFSSKGTIIDTVWKASVIILTMLYTLIKINFKIHKYILLPMMIYILGQLIAIIWPQQFSNNPVISRVVSIIIILGMCYFFISIPNILKKYSIDDIICFFNYFIILMIYAVLFNLITNPSSVLKVFSVSNAYENMMTSFFDNKQTFGMFLFMGILISVWQYCIINKQKYILSTFFFIINLFICLSRTALFSCFSFLLVFGILSLKVAPSISRKLIIGCLVLIFMIHFIQPINDFVFNVLIKTEDTMNARTNIWNDAFKLLNGSRLLIGYGEGNVATVLSSINSTGTNSHNGIIYVLLTGGIIKLIIYFIINIYSLYNIISIYRYDKNMCIIEISVYVGITCFSMGEALVLLDSSAPSIIASILVIAFPILIRRIVTSS